MKYKVILILAFVCSIGYGQTTGDFRSNVTSGTWSTLASWQKWNGSAWVTPTAANDYPGGLASGANVTIRDGHTITINATPANNLGSLTIGGGVSGTLTGDGSIRSVTVSGNLTVNAAGTFDLNSNNITVNGTSQINGTLSDGSGSGTNIFGGLVTISGTGNLSTANNSNYTFGGGITNAGTFNKSGTGTVTLSATQTISSTTAMTLAGNLTANVGANITYSGSNTITQANSCVYNGNLSTSSTVLLSITGSCSVSGNLNIGAGSTYRASGSNLTITGTSTVAGTFGDNNDSGTNIFTGALTVGSTGTFSTANASPFTFSAGISNSGTFNKSGTGAVTLSATQTISTSTAMTLAGNITANAGVDITYSGSNTITLAGTNVYNANLSTSGTVSVLANGTNTISGNLVVGLGSSLTTSSNNLTITGTTTVNGTFTDNSNTGIDTFTGAVTVGTNGIWNTSASTTNSNVVFKNGFTHNNTTASALQFGGVTFSGNAQSLSSAAGTITITQLAIGNAGDASLNNYNFSNNDVTVTGNLTFAKGIVVTGSKNLYVQGTVSGASTTAGWVNGILKRAVGTTAVGSSTTVTFDIGTASAYGVVSYIATTVTVAGVTSMGYVSGDHPNISSSCLNSAKSINKYLNYATTATIARLDVTIGFVAAEQDGSLTVANLIGGIYTGSTWLYPNVNGTPSTNVPLRAVSVGSGQVQLAEVNTSFTPAGDPNVYGNGVWNGYSYNTTTSTYKGYFSYSGVSFDTRTSDVYAVNGDPYVVSMISNYQGCPVLMDNFNVSLKRTNFPTGYYQLDYNGHDDGMVAYINGSIINAANKPTWNTSAETNLWVGELNASSQVEFRWTEGSGGHFTSATFTLVTPAALVPGIISGDQSFCSSESAIKILSSSSAATSGCSSISYQWQSSLDNSIWSDISSATTATYTLPGGITQTTYYRRKALDACNRVAYSNVVTVSVFSSAPGDPAVYGDGQWIAYGYATQSFTSYKGYMTYSPLSFDTRTTDLLSNTSNILNYSPTYFGCTMPADNFSVRFKRTNIPAGNYQIDLNGHDDNFRIYKNGSLIFKNDAYVAGAESNVWTGSISSSDLIDIEWIEGTGGQFATLSMTLLSSTPTGLAPGSIVQNQTICSGDYPIIALTGTAATGGCNVVPLLGTTTIYSGYQWEVSYDNTNWTEVSGATAQNYTIPSTPTFTLDTWYRRRVTDQCGRLDYSNVVKITIDNTTYGTPTTYPTNEWRVYSYKDYNFTTYAGYFPVTTDSYDSQTYYTTSQSPYYATGYLGCTVPVANYSTSVKRKGFTSGIYQVSVAHDNEGSLLIDGNQIYSNTTTVASSTSVWVGPLNSTSQVDWRFKAGTSPNNTSISVVSFVPTSLNGGTIDGDKIVCRGDIPSPFTSLTLSSGGCYASSTDYYWQYSTNSGSSWITLASSQGTSYTPVQTIFTETWYRRAVVDVCGTVAYSNIAKVTINNTPPGNPATFPSNQWNAYVFDDPDWGSYIGYFSVANSLDFDTRNYFCNTCAPSVASVPLANQGLSYQGCQNVATNVGVKIRRQGVTTNGYYQIDLPYYDDETRLYINGTLVFSDPTWYNNIAKTNVWTGYMDGSTTIDLWYQNDNGPGGAYIKLNYLGATPPTGLVGGTIASVYSTYCVNDLPSFSSTALASGACYPSYIWQYSTDNSTWNDISSATSSTYSSLLPITSLIYYRRKATDACGNGPVYSNTITLNPTGTASGNPSVFGNGTWNAYLYASNVHASPTNYSGYYTEPLLSFNTTSRFTSTSAPSSASGYQGCQTQSTNYTVALKRTNFTAGTYQIDLNNHDDYVTIIIDGVTVLSHTNGCCDAHSNFWTGLLGPSSQIEIRYTNLGGAGSLQATFTLVTPTGLTSAGAVSGTQTVCNGGSAIAFSETAAAVSGCYIYYQWQSSTDNITFANVIGATANTYTPSGITQVTYYRRKATDACGNVDYSNTLTVTPLPAVVGGTIGTSGTFCSTASVGLTQTAAPSGGDGSYTYQWQSSSDNLTYTNIGGATSATYTVPSLVATTYYRRATVSCGGTAYSNVVTLQLGAGTSITQQPPSTYTVCSGGTASIGLQVTGVAVTYQWQFYNGTVYAAIANNATYSGVATNTLQINNVTSGVTTGNYRCIITGSCTPTALTSNIVAVSIGGPTIALNPVNTTVCQNMDTSLTVLATGSLTYQWEVSTNSGSTWNSVSNGGIYSGANTNKLKFTNTTGVNSNQYRCVVTSSCGSSTSSAATITIQSPIASNTVTGSAVCTGSSITLNGNAVSSATYQWLLNSSGTYVAISGATGQNYTYTANSVQDYKRKVTVGVCVNTSSAYTVTPATAYSITTQPATTTTFCSGVATIAVVATNVTGYQWQLSTDGGTSYSSISASGIYSGETSNTLSINVNSGLTGNRYRARLTGCNGTGSSNSSVLVSNTTLNYTTHPASTSSCVNGSTTMSVVVGSTPTSSTLTYKWQYNLGAVTGNAFVDIASNAYVYNYNTATITISNPPSSFNGAQFRCVTSSPCAASSLTSNVATLTVYNAITGNGIGSAQTICSGEVPQLLTGSNPPTGGNGSFTYQWQLSTGGGYANISGATSVDYQPAALTATSNFVRVAYSGNCQANTSFPIQIQVGAPTSVVTNPSDANTCAGTNATFTVVGGGAALQYQWQTDNGTGTFVNITDVVNYSGKTSATLTVITPSFAYNGYKYRCVINGNCLPENVTSASATLNLSSAPVINTQPSFATNVCEGANATVSVVATGTGLTYQWQSKTGSASFVNLTEGAQYTNVAGASLTINSVTSSLNGTQYRCVITQASCSINSNAATIPVINKPVVTTQPLDKSICSGTNTTMTVAATGAGLAYQWEMTPPSGYTNVTGGGYSGATSTILSILAAPLSSNGKLFRAKVTGTCMPSGVFSNSATLTINGAGYWTGATNTDWNTTSNWCGAKPTITDDVVISNGLTNYPIVSTSSPIAQAKSISIGSSASLTISSTNQLDLSGSWTNNGNFIANQSTVTFTASTPQAIGGTSKTTFGNLKITNTSVVGMAVNTDIKVANSLELGANTVVNVGSNTITLASDASGTARLLPVPSTSSYSGNLAMQRYIPAKRSPRYVASPVVGATIARFKDSVIVAGPSSGGFDAPNTTIATFKNYDETRNTTDINKGWVSATSVTQTLNVGSGYYLYVPGKRTTVFPSAEAVTLQVKGAPFVGNKTINVTYTAAGIKGWNLVGNPYPSQIDWDSPSITKTNVDDAFYTWDATGSGQGQYYSYVNGIGSPSKTNPSIIPSMAGFFVKANASGASLALTENAKIGTSAMSVFRKAQIADLLRFKLLVNGATDDAVLYFNESATDGFDKSFDALKMLNTDLNIYTSIGGQDMSINAIGRTATDSIGIPLVVKMKTKGTFEIDFSEVRLSNWGELYLYDKFLNVNVPLIQGNSYLADQNDIQGSYSPDRFLITNRLSSSQVVTSHTDTEIGSAVISAYPNPIKNGPLTISLSNFKSSQIHIDVLTATGTKVHSGTYLNGKSVTLDCFKQLGAGIYILKATDSGFAKQIHVVKID